MHYEHKIINADDLIDLDLPPGQSLGAQGWRVVGVITTNAFTHRVILERVR